MMNDQDTWPELMLSSEVSERLRVSPSTVRRWIRDGELPAVRIGNQYRVRKSDVLKMLEPKPVQLAGDRVHPGGVVPSKR